MDKIVITGVGAITPIGNDPETFWENLCNGVSGAVPYEDEDLAALRVHAACKIKGFIPTEYMSRKEVRLATFASQLGLAASRQALEDSGLEIGKSIPAERVGAVINSGGGGTVENDIATRSLLSRGPRSISPFLVPRGMINAVSAIVSMSLGTKGPALTSALACASGNYALIEAAHMLQRGDVDAVLAGGTESVLIPLYMIGLARMGALSKWAGDPTLASRPFDATRDGFVFGEGAAIMMLERESDAQERGAKIYAEVLGGSLTADAFHITAPDPGGNGAVRAMQGAIRNAGLDNSDVDVIFAHGTSTPLNDATETKAIKAVFEEQAYDIPITATKSMVGHTMGAAGAISALAAVFSMRDGLLPPTINYNTPDPYCDLDYVPNEARAFSYRTAMINAFGFGGHNVALLLGKNNTE